MTCVELPSSLEAAADARSTVRRALGRVTVEVAAIACLLVDELVSDALFHVGAPLTLVIDLQPGRVAVEVIEHGPAAPGLGDRHATARRILDGMAADWGVELQGAGASAWFAIDLD